MSQYATKAYWNHRYQTEQEPFEWFQRYDAIKPILLNHIDEESKVLQVGCGNSELATSLANDGIQSIVNIDFSEVVIKQMKERYGHQSKLKFKSMDVEDLEFGDNSFDIIIDKGTFDTILCAEGANRKIEGMLNEIYRVLKRKGKFIMISYAKSQQRSTFLKKDIYSWKLSIETLPKPSHINIPLEEGAENHYIYILQKS
mmetsp:Transcript_7102/g.10465  ORF Transcript_7102/g.10465 Transcript_7102/m.10465 type:complete len:200 (+) Transcript_7102:57-656(+)